MSSVLETFLILFESNAEDVDKGNEKAKKSTKDLEAELKQVDAQTNKAAKSFLSLMTTAAGAFAATLSAGAVMASVFRAADADDALLKFSDSLGLNISDLDAWSTTVAMSGGSVEEFKGSVSALSMDLAEFAAKGASGFSPFFESLGVKMKDAKGDVRGVLEVLPDLADKFSTMSKQEGFGLGRKMGLDQGTIMLLQQGRREVEAQIAVQKELGTVTREGAEIAAKFHDQQTMTAKVFKNLFSVMGSSILPTLTRLLAGVQSVGTYMSKHADFFVGLLIAIGAAVTVYALPPLVAMAVAVVTAFAPFLLMGAVIAGVGVAFALLYDDIMNFIDGNDSLIGQILTAYPVIGQVIQGVIDYLGELWGAVKWVFDSIMSVLEISLAGWKMIFQIIGDGVSDFIANSDTIQALVGAITGAFETAGDVIGAIWDFIGERIMAVFGIIKSVIGFVKAAGSVISGALNDKKVDLGISGLDAGKDAIRTAASSPIGAQTSNAISNSSKSSSKSVSVQTGPISIETQATDSEGIAGEIGNSLGRQMKQTVDNFDDGVEA